MKKFLLGMTLVTWFLLSLTGCSGGGGASSSTRNGTISGQVFGLVSGVAGRAPLPGITVRATRREAPSLIRTVQSDANGRYSFFDVPIGTWDLTFQSLGFTSSGSAQALTSLRVFVESGGHAVAPDVLLQQTAGTGAGNVTLFLRDRATGAPIQGAAVTVGGFPPTFRGSDGTYTFSVPVSLSPGTGLPLPLAIQVSHPSLSTSLPSPSQVTPVAGLPVSLTVLVGSSETEILGVLRPQSFEGLYQASGALAQVSITSPQISPSFLAPILDPSTGAFSVRVPPSTSGGSVFFDLTFTSPFFETTTVSNILAPGPGGIENLSSSVLLRPHLSDVSGQIFDSRGVGPTGPPSEVVVLETGSRAFPFQGSYQFFSLPAGVNLTIRATVLSSLGGVETGEIRVFPLQGSFRAPPLATF